MRQLRAMGVHVGLACDVQRFRPELEAVTDQLFSVPIPRQIRPGADLQAYRQLKALIREFQPDIVHTHTSKAGFLGRLAAWRCSVPLILHTIYELPQNAVAASAAKRRLYWALEKVASYWCHHLVTISKINYDQITREGICSPHQLTLITEGLELDNYRQLTPPAQLRAAWGIPAEATLIGIAARLEKAKGHADLLRAFQQVQATIPNAWLVLIGAGELRPQLEAQIAELGLADRVRFAGWVDHLPSAMGALDLFVLSSHYEGLGVVLLEALAMGVPVVSTRVGGTQDIVDHGVNGLFAEPRNPADLAAKILQLLQDPELATAMAQAGKAKVAAQFRAEVSDQKREQLYRRLWKTTSRAWQP